MSGKTRVYSFYSKVYIDEELKRLGAKYNIHKCNGQQRLGTLGKAEPELLVAKLLVLVWAYPGKNEITLVGVLKEEFEEVLKRNGEWWFLDGLVEHGFLREELISGEVVIFPTEKLLKNQRIPERK